MKRERVSKASFTLFAEQDVHIKEVHLADPSLPFTIRGGGKCTIGRLSIGQHSSWFKTHLTAILVGAIATIIGGLVVAYIIYLLRLNAVRDLPASPNRGKNGQVSISRL